MAAFFICFIAFAASVLTFFSGFGLGTLLLPAFAVFYPLEVAVASTAVVHFLNGLFKLALIGRHADRRVVLRFGLPAIAAAFLGAWCLVHLSALPPLARYSLLGKAAEIHPVKLTIGLLLWIMTALEFLPRFAHGHTLGGRLEVGGLLSGFFGGLSGMQGALRSAFLIRLGLSKQAFIASGVAVSMLVDITRLGVYTRQILEHHAGMSMRILSAAVLSAFAGAILGNRFLEKVTWGLLHRIVGAMLMLVATALVLGLL